MIQIRHRQVLIDSIIMNSHVHSHTSKNITASHQQNYKTGKFLMLKILIDLILISDYGSKPLNSLIITIYDYATYTFSI